MIMESNKIPQSQHFTTTWIAPGVCAAVGSEGGAAISNAGLIDLGGQVVVYDTFLTLQAARDLRALSEAVFGQPPRMVINSHYHNDHIWGNQVFLPEAQIISTSQTYQLITTAGGEEYQYYSANSKQRLQSLQAQLQETRDPEQRRQIKMWLSYYAGLLETLPTLEISLPTVTFEHALGLHGTQRSARLNVFDGAHTGSDTVLLLPQDGIVFMSDLLFVETHPYLPDGNPFLMLNVLQELSKSDAEYFVPGHGPVGTLQDLEKMIYYIEYCLEEASNLLDGNGTLEERINGLQVPNEFKNWGLSQFYQANIRFLCLGINEE